VIIRAACDDAVSLSSLSRQRKQRGVAKISPDKSITRRSMPMPLHAMTEIPTHRHCDLGL
jgi:hypothetical protein